LADASATHLGGIVGVREGGQQSVEFFASDWIVGAAIERRSLFRFTVLVTHCLGEAAFLPLTETMEV
jgi:hypothetical protein